MPSLMQRTLAGLGKTASLTALKSLVDFAALLALVDILEVPNPFGLFFFVFIGAELTLRLSSVGGYRYIIQAPALRDADVATVLTLEGGLAVAWSVVWWFAAPLYLTWLGWGELVGAAHLLTLWILSERVGQPARSLLEREMCFGRANGALFGGTLAMAATSVTLALGGMGVMALVVGRVAQSLVSTALLWLFARRAPRLGVARDALAPLLRFGLPLLGADLLTFYIWNAPPLLIGQLQRDAAMLGLYYAAFKLPEYLRQLQDITSNVVYPAFSRTQSDEQLREGFRLATKYSAAVSLLPVALVLALGRGVPINLLRPEFAGATAALVVYTALASFRMTTVYWYHALVSRGHTAPLPLLSGLNALGVTVGTLAGLAWGQRWAGTVGGITGVSVGVALSNVAVTLLALIVFLPRVVRFRYFPVVVRPLVAGAVALALGAAARLVGLDLTAPPVFWTTVATMAGVYAAALLALDAAELRTLWRRLRRDPRAVQNY